MTFNSSLLTEFSRFLMQMSDFKKEESSAYIEVLKLEQLGKSFILIRKNSTPSTEPCGAPMLKG